MKAYKLYELPFKLGGIKKVYGPVSQDEKEMIDGFRRIAKEKKSKMTNTIK